MSNIEALEGDVGFEGVVWHPLVGWRRPGVPWGAPRCPVPLGITWAVSDPLPRP